MIEITEFELKTMIQNDRQLIIVFVYTPMCGTCKVAQQMLEIIELTYSDIVLFKTNIQNIPTLRNQLQISSVPCLLRYKNQQQLKPIYAFQSVPYLVSQIRLLTEQSED